MTAKEFYNSAVKIAQNRGWLTPQITTVSAVYHGKLQHYCQLWISEKRKFVNSGHHNSPSEALKAFADAIDYENKAYDKTQEDIDIE